LGYGFARVIELQMRLAIGRARKVDQKCDLLSGTARSGDAVARAVAGAGMLIVAEDMLAR